MSHVCTSAEPTQREINSKYTMATDGQLQYPIGVGSHPFFGKGVQKWN